MEKLLSNIQKIMAIIEGNSVRLDYISYVVAVVCFLFAGIVFAITPAYITDFTIVATLTLVLVILGLILVGVGYSQRPKEAKLPPSTLSPEPPTPAASAIPERTPTPTTAAPPEEPKMPQEEVTPEKKTVRKRRKKA